MTLKEKYKALTNATAEADAFWYRNRGFKFERLLNSMLSEEKLSPRTSYKTQGEQIDGSFMFGQNIYLLEAKWHKDELPASKIYEFKGKVDGKLIGTIGIFISMSGFSKDAVDALLYGKTVNVILFDRDDIEACFQGKNGFTQVLSTKIRKAAEEGTAYYPVKKVVVHDTVDKDESEISHFAFDLADNNLLTVSNDDSVYGDLTIICEGKVDQLILSLLSKRILKRENKKKILVLLLQWGNIVLRELLLMLEIV